METRHALFNEKLVLSMKVYIEGQMETLSN